MKKLFLFTIVFLVLVVSATQAQTTEQNSKFREGKLVVKWSPVYLLAHFPSLQIAIEHRVAKNLALQYDFGPVLNIGGVLTNIDNHKQGYRAKFHVRYYLTGKQHWKYFVASEVGYNNVTYMGYHAYHVVPENNYDYYQYMATPSTYKEKNISLLGGARFSAYRFSVEFQFGAIIRSMKYKSDSPGEQYTLTPDREKRDVFHNFKSRDEIQPTGAIRLCYIIR